MPDRRSLTFFPERRGMLGQTGFRQLRPRGRICLHQLKSMFLSNILQDQMKSGCFTSADFSFKLIHRLNVMLLPSNGPHVVIFLTDAIVYNNSVARRLTTRNRCCLVALKNMAQAGF